MCAIIGFASYQPIKEKKWLNIGRDAMLHRGPDGFGEWWSSDDRVGFGHRRLSIHDLSIAGHQPMLDQTDAHTLVFNGEIYNYIEIRKVLISKGYRFVSDSDTEVLLYSWIEWQEQCVVQLNGMFSFAIYDKNRDIVFMARDRAGEKPLFYSVNDGELRFSSELKGLLVDPSFSHSLDKKSLDCYLSLGYVPGDMCIINGVHKLPPAHTMVFNCKDGTVSVSEYWSLPIVKDQGNLDKNDGLILNELEILLEQSISRQLNADVPVGILLSGGVDSSLITAIACRISKKVKTYSIGFSQYEQYDELPHARNVSNYFQTDHTELQANNINTDLLYKLAKQYDEPMADSSMLPTYLVSKLVKKHCTVALGGDGGDELFGGYHYYSRLFQTYKIGKYIPFIVRKFIFGFLKKVSKTGLKGHALISELSIDYGNELPKPTSFFGYRARKKLLNNYSESVADEVFENRTPRVKGLLARAMIMDFKNYLPEDILVKVDRASMINSLELRSPFLDYHVIEYAFGQVPLRLKTSHNQRKIILKKLSKKILPKNFDRQRKQGFSIPLKEWLKEGEWRDMFKKVLLASDCMFNKDFIEKLLDEQDKGRNHQERLFSLVIFELWRREYNIS
jgi:asparagine synthase (glutamine-hydrolysing)